MISSSSDFLNTGHAEALVRVIEGAPEVRRRYHFFIWTRGPLQRLLPHSLAVCGAYQRNTREMAFEAFHSIAVAPPVLELLTTPRSPLLRAAQAAWVAGRGRPLVLQLDGPQLPADAPMRAALHDAGYAQMLAHGVSRPQRASEIESFFLLGTPHRTAGKHELLYLDLLLPHIHSAYLRVQSLERELGSGPTPQREKPVAATTAGITVRETQILRWVRDGKNNQQIGEVLNISPLTVKNHVQKILRKLGAANRAQAVARAMSRNLLAGGSVDGDAAEHE